jgi:hypothetical protein
MKKMKRYTGDDMDWTSGKPICPECINHIKLDADDDRDEKDCKNIYFKLDRKTGDMVIGQCCCYSNEHDKEE